MTFAPSASRPDHEIRSDRKLLELILRNLIDNAIKFTPSGGRVVVSLKEESTNLVMVSITDTGIGIPAHRLKEIFEPFHQLDASSTRKVGGTGLGLTICSRLVALMSGRIWVESQPGQGATFSFVLPYSHEEANV